MPAFPSCQREGVAGQARSPGIHLDDTDRRGGTEQAQRPCNSLGVRHAAIEQRQTLDAVPFDLNRCCSRDELAEGYWHQPRLSAGGSGELSEPSGGCGIARAAGTAFTEAIIGGKEACRAHSARAPESPTSRCNC